MVSAEFLRERAESFLRNAKDLIKKHEYAIAAFNLEQAAQLYIKYYIFLKINDFPRTHMLKILLSELAKVYPKKSKDIENLKEGNINLISDLEHAYVSSRYLPEEFTKTQVENMLKFVEQLINFLARL